MKGLGVFLRQLQERLVGEIPKSFHGGVKLQVFHEFRGDGNDTAFRVFAMSKVLNDSIGGDGKKSGGLPLEAFEIDFIRQLSLRASHEREKGTT